MTLPKVDNSSRWVRIYKSGVEVWVGGRKADNGKFTLGGVEFEVGDKPDRAEIVLRVVQKPESGKRSWED